MPYSTGLVLLLLALGAMLVPGCGDAEDAFCANMQDGTPCTFKETGAEGRVRRGGWVWR